MLHSRALLIEHNARMAIGSSGSSDRIGPYRTSTMRLHDVVLVELNHLRSEKPLRRPIAEPLAGNRRSRSVDLPANQLNSGAIPSGQFDQESARRSLRLRSALLGSGHRADLVRFGLAKALGAKVHGRAAKRSSRRVGGAETRGRRPNAPSQCWVRSQALGRLQEGSFPR